MQQSWSTSLQTLEGRLGEVIDVCFSPDSKRLASSSENSIKIWNVTTGMPQQTISGHQDEITSLTFSSDGMQLLSGSRDGTIKIWDAVTGALNRELDGGSGSVDAVRFLRGGTTLASKYSEGTVMLWDVFTGVWTRVRSDPLDDSGYGAFSSSGECWASICDDGTIRVWDVTTGVLLKTLEEAFDTLAIDVWDLGCAAAAFSPDDKQLASAWNQDSSTIKLWDTTTGKLQRTLRGHAELTTGVVFSADSKTLASSSVDGTIKLWDSLTGAVKQTLKSIAGRCNVLVFSPDGKSLASSSDEYVQLWDVTTDASSAQAELDGHSDLVMEIALSPDAEQVVSASSDKTIRLWSTNTGVLNKIIGERYEDFTAVSFSPDNKQLAAAARVSIAESEDSIKIYLWSTATSEMQHTFVGHSDTVFAVKYSPGGKQIASGSRDKTVKLWDVSTKTLQHTLEGHLDKVYGVVFSPNGEQIASVSFEQTFRLWNAATGVLLHACAQRTGGRPEVVVAVAFSPNSKRIASSSSDKTIALWDAATGSLQQTIKVGAVIQKFSFCNDGQSLDTAAGLVRINEKNQSVVSFLPFDYNEKAYIWVERDRILRNGKKLIWLPPDYRPWNQRCWCYWNDTLIIGQVNGQVTFWRFSKELDFN